MQDSREAEANEKKGYKQFIDQQRKTGVIANGYVIDTAAGPQELARIQLDGMGRYLHRPNTLAKIGKSVASNQILNIPDIMHSFFTRLALILALSLSGFGQVSFQLSPNPHPQFSDANG